MRKWRFWLVLVTAIGLVSMCPDHTSGAESAEAPSDGAVARILAEFSAAWPSDRTDYRSEGDDSWKAYAKALSGLVRLQEGAVSGVVKGLGDSNRQVRALSAAALGFLDASSSVGDLSRVLENDPWPTVRVAAADSLGMIHTAEAIRALERARNVEQTADVMTHIKIALGRTEGLDSTAVEALKDITDEVLDSAAVGADAPEIVLEDADGEKIALSNYRGKKHVILLFLYGDG